MGPTRFPYGQAKGFANAFGSGRSGNTAGLITESDATPDVTTGGLFYTNNSTATVITHFDLQDYANRAANYEGKVITVFFLDSNTRLANADRLFLNGTDNLVNRDTTSPHSIDLMHSRSGWYELTRSKNNRNAGATINVGGTLGVNFDDVSVAILSGTGGATNTIASISGGQVAQITTVVVRSGGANIVVTSAGNIFLQGTNAVTLASNNAYQFVKLDSANWSMLRPNLFV